MFQRVMSFVLVAVALGLFLGAPTLAQEKEGTHEGIVVKAGGDKLVMSDKSGKNEHTHTVSKAAKIICEDKECKLEDLKKGYSIRVTIEKENNKNVATRIEAKKSGS